MDHVPIRPRFNDEGPALVAGSAQQFVQPQVQSQQVLSPAAQTQQVVPNAMQPQQKGLFTSVYDNKLIVLIIAIIIIIIALAAYVIFRKDETADVPKPKPRRNNYPQENIDNRKNKAEGGNESDTSDENAGVQNTADTSREENTGTENTGAENTRAATQKNANTKSGNEATKQQDLQKLLARGRAAAAKVEKNEPVVEEYDDAKTENEILKLMEDDTTHEVDSANETQDATPTKTADEPLNTPTVESTQPTQDKSPATQSTALTLDPNKCSSIVKDRQCGNKPTKNGKCHVHGK